MSFTIKSKNKYLFITEEDFSVNLNLVNDVKAATIFNSKIEATEVLTDILKQVEQQMENIRINPQQNAVLDLESLSEFNYLTITEQK